MQIACCSIDFNRYDLLWSSCFIYFTPLIYLKMKVKVQHAFTYWLKGMVGIPLNGTTRQHLCACPNPGPEFPSDYIVDLFVFDDFMWEVVVRFVDIGGIVYHHCFHLLFVIYYEISWWDQRRQFLFYKPANCLFLTKLPKQGCMRYS